jgi:flagellin-like hook-associated protein FlgL
MDLSAIALQGINQAEMQLDATTTSLASAGVPANGGGVDVVDVASQMVAMNSADILLQLSLSTLKTSDQLQKNVIDLLA